MILRVKSITPNPAAKIRSMKLVEVIGQETLDGRDTHAVFDPDAFKDNETLCEGFFLPETNEKFLTPEMQALLNGMETIELPTTINKLRPNTFEGCRSLTTLDIPNGIDSIPESCFKDCEALNQVNMPDTVVEIGPSAFENCISLVGIELPDGMGSISDGCFRNCKSLLEINVPSSVKEIGSSAFWDCDNLKRVSLPEGLVAISEYSFFGCHSLNSVIFPDSLQVIGPAAFCSCTTLREASIPGGVKRIGQYSTEGTHSSGYNGVFENCRNLTKVDLAEGISMLSEKCFKDCTALESIKIPASVNRIFDSAFENCVKLTNIDLPAGIQYIDDNLFSRCINLEEVIIPDSVIEIGSSAFSGCEKLSCISLPDSVKEIGMSAFQDCSRLRGFSFPDGVESIQYGCFSGCKNLEKIRIPNSIREFGSSAFKGCAKLRSFLIPDGVISIGSECFKDSRSLEEIIIPDSVINIGNSIFDNCSNLKSVTLPARLKNFAEQLFTGNCHPETINYEESSIFILEDNLLLSNDGKTLIKYQKSDLKEFEVPKNIVKIKADAFADSRINGPEVLVFRHLLDNLELDLKWKGIKKVVILDEVFLQNVNSFIRMGVPIEVINSNEKIVGKFINVDFYGTSSESIAKFDDYQIGKGVYSTPDKEEKIETFLTRLDYPFELSEQAKQKMIAYVKTNKKEALQWIFQNSRFEELQNNAQYLLTKFNIDQIIELATNSKNPGLMAFLLNFKMNTLKMDPDKTKPLVLTPLDPNSLREVQKDWILTGLNLPELTVSEYRGEQKSTLVLPTFAGKKPITRVGTHCNWLRAEEIIIPDGYRVIEESALMNKRAGKIIFMADSVVEIGAKAFAGADRLEEVRLSDRLTKIKDRTFEGCVSLIKVNIPADLVSIGKAAFKICANLELLEISEKVTEIGKDAFADCPKLVIHAPKGSYAIEYARDNGIKYVEI
jgi:hypothetical protein